MGREYKTKDISMFLGIGNPESEHRNTYHNVGKLFADFLAEKLNMPNFKRPAKNGFEYTSDGKLIVGKSLVFMNDSGRATREILGYFKKKSQDIVIVQDDSDIQLGEYKISFGRGSAGHRGIESIIATLDANDFWRLRIGIRHSEGRAGDFVLDQIKSENQAVLRETFQEAANEILLL